ncbi:MAG: hypothetical protein EAZ13_01495 [Sphingobacteriia bacterium]|nr:MAG: hypothetical protein EAZ13_01495 [Sphingobacteriia bacterium]
MKNFLFCLALITTTTFSLAQLTPQKQYEAVQQNLQTGWGTFNHKSVLSHVLLPAGIALNIGLKFAEIEANGYLKEAYISSRDPRPETIVPGYHALDGSYTDLIVTWKKIKFRVQSAVTNSKELVLLITPIELPDRAVNIILETGIFWNKKGTLKKIGESIIANTAGKQMAIHGIGNTIEESVAASAPYMALQFNKEVAFYTGTKQSLSSIKNIIAAQRIQVEKNIASFGTSAETYKAIERVIGWNIIYDAAQKRVIYPVSRLWNDNFGGQSVLFCWDTYFSAYMASMKSKELAYANAIEITKSITPGGFIPNWSGSYKNASFDRSQPPVGSLVFKELYRKYKEKWVLDYVFEDLLKWNRWWPKNRDDNGMLCWGSNKVLPPLVGDFAANAWQGAAYESGLDNSPMFDGVPFNAEKNMLALADAGLMGMYGMDCDALAEIAQVLNKPAIAKELRERGNFYRQQLGKLWSDATGIYLNKRTDIGSFSPVTSPTNFYPLLAKAASQQQAERMMKEHLLNPEAFNTPWMIPSVSLKSEAYRDQAYWRGRIWGPMNFLVYMGLLNYDLPEARKILSEKSNRLFLENTRINGWVFENYNGITGNITNQEEGKSMGDNYYHWGALLGFIAMIENGYVANPSKPIQ